MIFLAAVGLATSCMLVVWGFIYVGNYFAAKGREHGRLNAHREDIQRARNYERGLAYVNSFSVCPKCNQKPRDSIISTRCTGGGDVECFHCEHPFHAIECLTGPYTSINSPTIEKLIIIGHGLEHNDAKAARL